MTQKISPKIAENISIATPASHYYSMEHFHKGSCVDHAHRDYGPQKGKNIKL